MERFRGFPRLALMGIGLAAGGAALLGILDGSISASRQSVVGLGVAIWVAVGAIVPIVLPLGFLQGAAAFALQRLLGSRQAPRWWSALTGPRQDDPSRLVVRAHAWVLLGLGALVIVMGLVWKTDSALSVIQDPTFRRLLLVIAVGLFAVLAAVAAVLASSPLTRIFTRVDERVGLPWPASAFGRFVVYIGAPILVPSLLVCVPLLARYGNELAPLILPIGLVLFVEFELLAYVIYRAFEGTAARRVLWLVLVLIGLGASLLPFSLKRVPGGPAAAAAGIYTRSAIAFWTRVTDIDHDRFSSFYAGGDCAPRDPKVHAAAVDIPGNGKDENCDGFDPPADAPIERAPLFSNTRKRVAQYDILWIIVDAVRAANVQVGGYARPTTPALNQLAESSLVFRNAYSPSSTTHLSFSCMMTGKNAESLTWQRFGDPTRLEPAEQHRTLAERLRSAGYRNVAIVSRFLSKLPEIFRGFDTIISDHRRVFRHDGPSATSTAIDVFREHTGASKQPLFTLLYYEDPHMPYDAGGPGFPSFGAQDQDRYDGEIAYVDRYLGFLFDYMRAHPASWENTIVVITADHGEEFGEHGGAAHGKTCYEESTHVPLIVRVPGLPPARIEQRVTLVDVVPTVLELVGIPATTQELDGRSLLALTEPAATAAPAFCAIMNQGTVLRGRPFFQRSVRYGSRALIHDLLVNEFALFDTDHDRAEKNNLIAEPKEQPTFRYLKRLLDANATGNMFQNQIR